MASPAEREHAQNAALSMKIGYTDLKEINKEIDLKESKSIIVLGANGSGKSSLSRKIKNDYAEKCLRIPSQKDLFIPQTFTIVAEDSALNNLGKTRITAQGHQRISNNEMMDDFYEVITILISNHMSVFAKFGEETKKNDRKGEAPESKFEKVNSIFSKVFDNSSLKVEKQKIKMNDYDLDDISDGERAAIYLISRCILDNDAKLIVVDEPESHLNSALINELWDLIEEEKKDVKFLYLTHNIEFADYKNGAKRFWIKDFDYKEKRWDIKEISDFEIPNDLVIRIIGVKKKKILFCEGRRESGTRDYELYRHLYPGFTVIPVTSGSCFDVIKYVKALRTSGQIYNKEYFGLVDRDFRSDESVLKDEADGIFSLPTAIYEGLFLREEIIGLFTKSNESDKGLIFESIKEKYDSYDLLNAKNRDKIHKEANKKREELKELIELRELKQLKQSQSEPSSILIEVKLDWTSGESLSHNEMLKTLKSKDIKNIYKYSEIVEFVKREIINKDSELYREIKKFMPDIVLKIKNTDTKQG